LIVSHNQKNHRVSNEEEAFKCFKKLISGSKTLLFILVNKIVVLLITGVLYSSGLQFHSCKTKRSADFVITLYTGFTKLNKKKQALTHSCVACCIVCLIIRNERSAKVAALLGRVAK
jgi:hypothetical protein